MKQLFFVMAAAAFLSLPVAVCAEETVIPEQVIYDEDGRKVTVTGYEEGWMGPEIKVTVENETDEAFILQIRDSSVNGIMTDLSASIEVEPGKTANDSLSIMSSVIDTNGIDQVADIEFSLHFFDPESYDTLLDSDPIRIETNLSGTYEQINDDSGEELYNENGVRIVSQGLSEDTIWGAELMFYIENNTEQEICVQLRDTSINGIMVDPSFSEEVMPGKTSINGAVLFSSDMENIGEIKEMETSFHIYDKNTYDTIVDTDPILITY